MARYYNKTTGLITVTLKDGAAAVVPPKQFLPVPREQDGSSSLRKAVSKGFLLRMEDPKPAPAPVEAPPPAEPVSAPEEEDPPSMDWRKDELVAYAEGRSLDVSGMTKAQILEAIEGAA